jgi:signal transduction histidine kinase
VTLPTPRHPELAQLAAHLAKRRDAILKAWREAVTRDPSLTTGAALPRAQLHDHIPALLRELERRLAGPEVTSTPAGDQKVAEAHGLHRWQQGFDLAEVTRELGRLNECVVVELDDYAAAHPELASAVMADARRVWANQCGTAISASTSQYFELQQIEASSHVKDLEAALSALRDLERQRAQLWQQAAHDLRGNLGVVANATAGLASARSTDAARASFMRLLDRNVEALHHLLNDVTSLARLQAGQEQRRLEHADVAGVLRELCEAMHSRAAERNLFLRFSGPQTLTVEADVVKIRRIAQNLVLNAIKYTRRGGITIGWGDATVTDSERWFLQVEDTGPGFHAGPGAQLAGVMETATGQSKKLDADAAAGRMGEAVAASEPPEDERPVNQETGEGIGLSIVKRLCDLLDGSVQLESDIAVGTTFRILFPRHYVDTQG